MVRKAIQLGLVGYALGLLYAGWMPLSVRLYPRTAARELRTALSEPSAQWAAALRTGDGARNVLLFVPLGAAVVAGWHGPRRWRLLVPAAGLVAAAVSLGIETGQLVNPDRCARLTDVVLNVAGGLMGAIAAALLVRPARAVGRRLAPHLRNRHALLGATALVLVLIVSTVWRCRASAALAAHQWSAVVWPLSAGLATRPWHDWLVRQVGPFAALTLLLASAAACPHIPWRRALAAAWTASVLAGALEALGLFIPGQRPSLAGVAVACAAALTAGLAAPALQRRQVTLRAGVLLGALGLVILLAYISWSSAGGGTRWPLWGLYRHELAWGYYASVRRWATAATVSLLLALYVSLCCPWRLRHRMVAGALAAVACVAVLETAKVLAGPRGGSVANLLEHVLSALAGGLLFAVAWRLLDRRARGDRRLMPRGQADRRKTV